MKQGNKLARQHVGSSFAIFANLKGLYPWLSDILQDSPSATIVLCRSYAAHKVFSGNPAVVQHILRTNFPNYEKGDISRRALTDFLGHGISNVDGESWKFQRQVSSHEFNTKSLRKFVETVVDTELSDRLIPILSSAAKHGTVLDFQDILQRFAFDNICKIALGFDPAYLFPSLPQAKLALAFEDGVRYSSERFDALLPVIWKIKKLLNIGSEKRLRIAMGRLETLWGSDWAEFKPERWLQKEEENSNSKSSSSWKFVGRDSYTYPVFQAGPRICLGKDMAFLQMKRVVGLVAVVLRRFKVMPAFEQGVHHEPEYMYYLTSKKKGGFPVKIMERDHHL